MADPRPPGAGRWSDPELAATAESLGRLYGLEFGPSRIASAEDAMRRVMQTLGIRDARALRERAGRSDEAREALVAALTIGETYFFREPGQLHYLRDAVLPELARDLARDAGAGPLRLWSAGCSTGEEPYSLAILLREAGWTHEARVLGTDLVPARLARARRGRYGAWSMRGVPEATVDRWFRRQGRVYHLDDEVRGSVEFRVLDLARDDYALAGPANVDVVFCRNVLIYFDAPTVREVARRLLDALSPRGWLFLSATDPVLSDYVSCEAVPTGAGYAYRRAAAAPARSSGPGARSSGPGAALAPPPTAPGAAASASRPLPGHPPAAAGSRSSTVGRAPADAAGRGEPHGARGTPPRATEGGAPGTGSRAAGAESPEEADVAHVRALANRGALAEAGQACAAALDRHPLSPRLAMLHATLLLQAGRAADAAAAARRSLYLDRRAPVAHLILGDALARAGDAVGAARAFANAADLLDALPPDAPVADADGEPARRLAQMARHRAGR